MENFVFFFQAEDGIRDIGVTGVQTCALPIYVSDFCVNNCVYCGYKKDNHFHRRKLTMEEVRKEVMILEEMGHKRLALEAGEDPMNCDMEYILKCIDTIYDTYNKNGKIRRINVNIAATTVERSEERRVGKECR